MAIIISENGKEAETITETPLDQESKLQQLIHDNPNTIPLYEIDSDTRLFIAAREFWTNSGPIDALGFDAKGNIYVIETKLQKNPDKRYVVAQALDYGASLWRHAVNFDVFIASLDEKTTKHFGEKFEDKFVKFFGETADPEYLTNIKSNLAEGVIKFVVLMDRLEPNLKDLVLYVNQNSRFDIYAVELKYYKHKTFEILIPKIFGAEVKKDVVGQKPRSSSITMDELWASIQTKLPDKEYVAVRELIELLLSKSSSTIMGTTSIGIRFKEIGEKSLVTFYKYGTASLNFGNIPNIEDKNRLKELVSTHLAGLWQQPKFQKENLFTTYPSFSANDMASNNEQLKVVFKDFFKK